MEWRGKKITVMGLGLHGGAIGNIRWFTQQGANLTVTDLKSQEQLAASVEQLKDVAGITFVLGKHRDQDFSEAQIVIRNPAVPRDSKYLQLAKKSGAQVMMDSSIFFAEAASTEIIGVTGSKGKTTTSRAIETVLQGGARPVIAVGVDGVSPLAKLSKISKEHIVVFELSSWRLEALDEIQRSPHVAVVTSLYKEHLNTYDGFADYVAAKKIIVRYQKAGDLALLNFDDSEVRKWQSEIQGRLAWYSLENLKEGEGIFVRDGKITVRKSAIETEIMPLSDLPLTAEHERRNLLPALFLGIEYGLSLEILRDRIHQIQRLPHRLEEVRILNGVIYINDSAATMPDATIAALRAFSGKPIIHILGGSDKKLEYAELKKVEEESKIKARVWLPGTVTERMKKEMGAGRYASISEEDADSMQAAVQIANSLAAPGDFVLLSPAATSFGLFQHEFDRGDQFREAVKKL